MMNRECKYCKFMNVTIVPPSSKQYCTHKKIYVKLHNVCDEFLYDETIPGKIKEYGDIE